MKTFTVRHPLDLTGRGCVRTVFEPRYIEMNESESIVGLRREKVILACSDHLECV